MAVFSLNGGVKGQKQMHLNNFSSSGSKKKPGLGGLLVEHMGEKGSGLGGEMGGSCLISRRMSIDANLCRVVHHDMDHCHAKYQVSQQPCRGTSVV